MVIGNNDLAKKRKPYNFAEVQLHILAKFKPEVATFINSKYQELMPEIVFSDYGLIPEFGYEFCAYHNINPEQISGRKISTTHMDLRKQFLAVLLFCYHPEKIIEGGITDKRVWQGLELYAGQYLNCLDKSLAMQIHDVVVAYKTYKDFSGPVSQVHALILEKYKHRANEKQVRAYAGFSRPTAQLNIFG